MTGLALCTDPSVWKYEPSNSYINGGSYEEYFYSFDLNTTTIVTNVYNLIQFNLADPTSTTFNRTANATFSALYGDFEFEMSCTLPYGDAVTEVDLTYFHNYFSNGVYNTSQTVTVTMGAINVFTVRIPFTCRANLSGLNFRITTSASAGHIIKGYYSLKRRFPGYTNSFHPVTVIEIDQISASQYVNISGVGCVEYVISDALKGTIPPYSGP